MSAAARPWLALACVWAACGAKAPEGAPDGVTTPGAGPPRGAFVAGQDEDRPPPQGHEWLVWHADGRAATGGTTTWVRAGDPIQVIATRAEPVVAEGEHLYAVRAIATPDAAPPCPGAAQAPASGHPGARLQDLLGDAAAIIVAPPAVAAGVAPRAQLRLLGGGDGKLYFRRDLVRSPCEGPALAEAEFVVFDVDTRQRVSQDVPGLAHRVPDEGALAALGLTGRGAPGPPALFGWAIVGHEGGVAAAYVFRAPAGAGEPLEETVRGPLRAELGFDDPPGAVAALVREQRLEGPIGWSKVTLHDDARARALAAFQDTTTLPAP